MEADLYDENDIYNLPFLQKKIFFMIKEQYKHSELTGKIIGASMKVHKILGNGFQEVIYQRELDKQMRSQNVIFDREFEMPIFLKISR